MSVGIYMTNFLFLLNNWYYLANVSGSGAGSVNTNYTDNPEKVESYVDSTMMAALKDIYDIFKIAIPVLIFVLSTVDFIIAIAGKEEQMKKASNKLIKRLIFGVLFFVIPLILDMIFALTKIGSTGNIAG